MKLYKRNKRKQKVYTGDELPEGMFITKKLNGFGMWRGGLLPSNEDYVAMQVIDLQGKDIMFAFPHRWLNKLMKLKQ